MLPLVQMLLEMLGLCTDADLERKGVAPNGAARISQSIQSSTLENTVGR
jgi:hypothetical protein